MPSGLSSLKSKVDNLDVDKLIPAPVTLSKPSYVVKNNVVQKDKKFKILKIKYLILLI